MSTPNSSTTSTMKSTSMSTGNDGGTTNETHHKINHGLLLAFVHILMEKDCYTSYITYRKDVSQFFIWLRHNRPTSEYVQHMERIAQKKSDRRMKQLTSSLSSGYKSDDCINQELMTNQVKQLLRAAASIATYAQTDARILQLFISKFDKDRLNVSFVNANQYLTRIIGGSRPAASSAVHAPVPLQLNTPTNLEALFFFHACTYFAMNVKKQTVTYLVGHRIGFAVQLACNALVRCIKSITVEEIDKVTDFIMPYIFYDHTTGLFRVIKSRGEGFSSTNMETTLHDITISTNQAMVSVIAWHRCIDTDTGIRFILDLFLRELNSLLCRNYLYQCEAERLLQWKHVRRLALPDVSTQLPAIFSCLPTAVAQHLGLNKPDPLVSSPEPDVEIIDIVHSNDDDQHDDTAPQPSPVGVKRNDHDGSVDDSAHNKMRKLDASSSSSSKQQQTMSENTPVQQDEQRDEEQQRPPPPAPAPVAKEEPLLAETVSNQRTDMSQEVNKAFFDVRAEMLHRFPCHDTDFRLLVEAEEDKGNDLTEAVDFVLTDPPFNIRRNQNLPNSGHDRLQCTDMESVVDIISRCLKPGGHGVIFCSDMQFHHWYQALHSRQIEVSDDEVEPIGSAKKMDRIFEVERKALTFLRKPGFYTSKTTRTNVSHVNVVETAIHFWKKGLSPSTNVSRVNYNHQPEMGALYPLWTNVMTDIPQPTGREVVYAKRSGGQQQNSTTTTSGKRPQLRPEQKSIQWMMELLEKFTLPGGCVLDFFSGTYSVAKACMSLKKHRKFIGGDADLNCFGYAEDSLVETYARQLLDRESDINTTSAVVHKAAQLYVSDVERLGHENRTSAWSVPRGLSSCQTFPKHILDYISEYYNKKTISAAASRTPMNKWSADWKMRVNNLDVAALRTHECLHLGVSLRPSTIKSEKAGLGVFATRNFDRDEVVGYYYGALVYGDLAIDRKLTKRYGEGVLSVSSNDFSKWAAELTYNFKSTDGKRHKGWIAPTPWCVMRYINDPRYLADDKATRQEKRDNRRTANCAFTQKGKASINRHYEQYDVLRIVAATQILCGSELFIDYGQSYQFKHT